jgi:Concanavalin A-like lectin/glucanases superfamily/Divergent InlB B-repeat domain/Immunoglobulin I-set domain
MLKYLHDPSGNLASQTAGNVLLPKIIGQPVKQIVEPGQVATFSVVVEDTSGVTFQWQFNGTDIPGATSDSLLLTNVSAANEGQYTVVPTNSAGSVTSAPAALLLDTDRDGLPDSWEIANFGNITSQRSEGDPDGDGISNLDEFLDGTDPTNKNSLRPRLTLDSYIGTAGSITATPMKLSYDLGETVTLTATPFPPSVFGYWAGDLNGNANPATLTMDKNKTVRARFAAPAHLPPGLIALWRGETNASDPIGGHNGTFFVGAAVTAPSITGSGKVGAAFDFDGTVYVRVPDDATLRLAQFTAEAWVFLTVSNFNVPQAIIARGYYAKGWDLRLTSRIPEFWSQGQALVGPPIPLNEWTHLAISLDGATKRLYVNGAEVASAKQPNALIYDATPVPVTIGSDWENNASGNGFNGRIDEVALYNRALTADEVYSIYFADFMGKNLLQPYFTSPSQLPDGVTGVNYTQQLVTPGHAPR